MQSLADQYRELHSKGVFRGTTWRRHSEEFCAIIDSYTTESLTIVDWGCGPLGGIGCLAAAYLDRHRVLSYDPYVKDYCDEPIAEELIDVLFSSDVLEHMDQETLDAFTAMIRSRPSIQLIYLAISTRAANKFLPDGRNAHLTIMSNVEWQVYLTEHLPGYIVELHRYSREYEDVVLVLEKAS